MDGRLAVTPRQAAILALVARGQSTKEIAATIGVTERAVTAQITRLMQRFGAPNRAGLIATVMSSSAIVFPSAAFAEAYDNAPFMVAVTRGPTHRYLFVNRVAAEVAGRAAETLVGRTVREAYPEIDTRFTGALDEVYRTGVPWSAEQADVVWTHPDGSRRSGRLNLMFQPLRDPSGAIVGLLHIGAEP